MDNKKNGIPKLRFPGFTGAWEQRKLSSMTQYKNGKGHEDKQTDSGDFELVNLNSISIDGGFKHSGKFINESDDGILYKNDLVMILSDVGHGDLLGRVALIPDDNKFILNQRVALLRPNKTVNPEFLFFYINSHQKYFKSQGAGMSQLNISKKSVETFSSLVPNIDEQKKISLFLMKLDSLITLHQRKLEHLQEQKKGLLQKMFPKNGETVPEVRFPGFTDAWEQRKLGEEFKRVNERNNGEFGKDRWISVAKMYFQDPDKVTSNNIDTRTYVMRFGDIAFEGHPNNEFKFGRFVANDIGDGVVSELFPIYRHIRDYDNNYWKYAIHLERIMGPIFAKSITSSGNSSNKLAPKDLLRQSIFLPHLDEQKEIGNFLKKMDSLITLHQRKLDHLELMKKGLLQQMFV
ncbi:type I restriction endonuclease subunit S [Lactobacillus sp. UMNPBX9]|nr:type I restriction endonuclease subunit S [Lactobacillus sp. UMNPBX9]